MKNNILVSLIATVLCASCHISKTQKNKTVDVVEIPFVLTSHNNIAIEAVFNDTDTLTLMFHSAANAIALTENATEKMRTINWSSETEANSWGGKAASRYSESNTLQICGLTWDSLEIWEDKNSGPFTDGKFGLNLFEGKVLEINFDNNLIKVHHDLPDYSSVYEQVPLIFENDFMFINGSTSIAEDSYLNRFLIHSGFGGSILYDDQFVAESKIGERIVITAEKELKDSFGNVLKTKKGNLPTFTIGSVNFENMPVGFFEGTIGRQSMSVLGGDLIKRFNIIIDAKREFIYFQPNDLMNLPFSEI